MIRYLTPFLQHDLQQKMVFMGGPRQVGKTTLAKYLCTESFQNCTYLNWDNDTDRQAILRKRWRQDASLIIFDELHKYPHWKRWIKGVYDVRTPQQTYLVTGSARLDVYRRGGDSLLGRYHYWRLHPFTLDELPESISPQEGLHQLLTFGGFPEPLLAGSEREARRWRKERFDRIIGEDIRDLEPIKHLQLLSLLTQALHSRVGGLITYSNLAEDLQVAPNTIKHWLEILARMYVLFPIYPYTLNLPRAIQKPPKIYFYDNGDVTNGLGARLENLVATTLLKRLHFLEDYHGHQCSLHYIRDKDGREVDFITVIDQKITDLIEVKSTDSSISTSLRYYSERLKPQNTIQLVADLQKPFHQDNILVTNPVDYFKENIPWEMRS